MSKKVASKSSAQKKTRAKTTAVKKTAAKKTAAKKTGAPSSTRKKAAGGALPGNPTIGRKRAAVAAKRARDEKIDESESASGESVG